MMYCVIVDERCYHCHAAGIENIVWTLSNYCRSLSLSCNDHFLFWYVLLYLSIWHGHTIYYAECFSASKIEQKCGNLCYNSPCNLEDMKIHIEDTYIGSICHRNYPTCYSRIWNK